MSVTCASISFASDFAFVRYDRSAPLYSGSTFRSPCSSAGKIASREPMLSFVWTSRPFALSACA